MGFGFGVFIGTFEGCHGEMLGSTMPDQLKYAAKQTIVCTYRRCVNYGCVRTTLQFWIRRPLALWESFWRQVSAGLRNCVAEMINSTRSLQVLSQERAGEVWSRVINHSEVGFSLKFRVYVVAMISSATKCSIGFVIFGLVMDYIIDSFQEEAAWTRHIKMPNSVI